MGWRESDIPICPELPGFHEVYVYKDDEAAYALVAYECSDLDGAPCGAFDFTGGGLYRNGGSGWEHVTSENLENPSGLASWPWGEVAAVNLQGCRVLALESAGPTCITSAPDGLSYGAEFGTADAFYALVDGALHGFDGASWWSLDTGMTTAAGLWVGGNDVLVAGQNVAGFYDITTQVWQPLDGTPAGFYNAAWAGNRDEVYLGDAFGQIAFLEGAAWSVVDVEDSVIDIWSDGSGSIYFITSAGFGRLMGTNVQWIVPPGPTNVRRFNSMWAVSPSEIYLGMKEGNFENSTCGEAVVMWYDGVAMHPF